MYLFRVKMDPNAIWGLKELQTKTAVLMTEVNILRLNTDKGPFLIFKSNFFFFYAVASKHFCISAS